jgi:opacity protein-like surface antigen
MKKAVFVIVVALWGLQPRLAAAGSSVDEPGWLFRFDMGGNIPQDATLSDYSGPVGSGELKLNPGFQMDMALDYKLTPWLAVGGELGFLYNGVDSVGGFTYQDTWLFQLPMMANVTLRYPNQTPLVPYVGAGIGGVASVLTFGGESGYYYYYWEPDGSGSAFTWAAQFYAGLNYRINDKAEIGVNYRFLYTGSQDWNVEWWDNYHFTAAVDSIQVHTFCLVFNVHF